MWSLPTLSVDHYKYYLILVDNFTRYTWIFPLKLKSQVKETFIAFKALVENRLNTKIGTLYSDNGGEFVALRSFLTSSGISHFTSPPHTPEHNGISERKHRHVVQTGLTLLTHAAMPKTYWSYAFSTAVYLINRQPTPLIHMESPYHKLFSVAPNYSKLRVYGCLCFPWLRSYTNNKLEDRSTPCVFIGYSQTQGAYLCLQPSTGRIYISRHVRFDEKVFPFAKPLPSQPVTHPLTETISSSPQINLIPFHPPQPPQSSSAPHPLSPSIAPSSHSEVGISHRPGYASPDLITSNPMASPLSSPAIEAQTDQTHSLPSPSPYTHQAQSTNEAPSSNPPSSDTSSSSPNSD